MSWGNLEAAGAKASGLEKPLGSGAPQPLQSWSSVLQAGKPSPAGPEEPPGLGLAGLRNSWGVGLEHGSWQGVSSNLAVAHSQPGRFDEAYLCSWNLWNQLDD